MMRRCRKHSGKNKKKKKGEVLNCQRRSLRRKKRI
jgi:hypothetical protein